VAITKEQLPDAIEIPAWEQDLRKVGFVRRALNARKWYGADWWFVAISSVMVVGFIIIAFFPDPFAPYGPHEIVGPSFLAPASPRPSELVVLRGHRLRS
jgi:hypothetical protein